ncbi:hypothetical protein [Maritimibacter alkaliphilus]|uniref:hypothetical protein n=1 Tax=Maritimibacter alkaliphilus TaxID=404236 RepID=UPI0011E7D9F2|nr:hypothetical protein [Maritimibacter alkaliphilus]
MKSETPGGDTGGLVLLDQDVRKLICLEYDSEVACLYLLKDTLSSRFTVSSIYVAKDVLRQAVCVIPKIEFPEVELGEANSVKFLDPIFQISIMTFLHCVDLPFLS